MRQLWSTGWCHNRARVVAASFLVKHLLLPWQWGLKHLWDCQIDAGGRGGGGAGRGGAGRPPHGAQRRRRASASRKPKPKPKPRQTWSATRWAGSTSRAASRTPTPSAT
jgi:hypothetical protein